MDIYTKYTMDPHGFAKRVIEEQTRYKLESVKDYISEIELKFKRDMEEINKRYEAEVAARHLDLETLKRMGEDFAVDYFEIEKVLLNIFRRSILVMVYSFIENSMNSLCRYLHGYKKLSIGIDDLKGVGIERAKLYLEKVCLIDLPNTWSRLEKLNRIRNCIVHAEGDVDATKSPGKLKNIIRHTKGLELESDRFIIIKESYVNSIVSSAEIFFNQLYEKAL